MTIAFVENGVRRQIAVSRIEYLAGEGNYSRIHFVDRGPVLVSYCLKVMEGQLTDFVRIHKATLVNPRHITGVSLGKYRDASIFLSGGRTLPVSRRRVTLISNQLC
ncbi:LytR/AlgR family response regulator transcription factor [Spirosoma radiotolerans]|uniref:LytR/AlgR family response regulator transcription factor n=1 Tax=Spirosoma radiotolerans TaxID=1379870 RepID=UPI000695E90D|nr:LytTR family DNA-binding domain-containing protein [Spirosoma radiotolerans]